MFERLYMKLETLKLQPKEKTIDCSIFEPVVNECWHILLEKLHPSFVSSSKEYQELKETLDSPVKGLYDVIEETGNVGSTNIFENETTFNFDDQNFITFRTRENKEIDLTEYYDLIYEYKNDCLVAGIKYNKTYYQDRDLQPTEDFMFTIKLVPLTAVEQKFAN